MGKRVIAICCLLAALLSGCGGESAAGGVTEQETSGISFTDDLDRTVTLSEPPRRVAALIGSFAEIWCLAGGKETLAASAGEIGRASCRERV